MSEFRIGEIANAKVGRNIVNVEIIEDCGNGCYKVKSLSTGREFSTCRVEKINNINMEENNMTDETNIIEQEINTAEVEESPNPAPECATAPQREKKLSLLDAAVEVLKSSGEPMNTREIVKAATDAGLWIPTGCKTPEQTLYGSIFREIKTKENPRIVKSEQKGKFQYAG